MPRQLSLGSWDVPMKRWEMGQKLCAVSCRRRRVPYTASAAPSFALSVPTLREVEYSSRVQAEDVVQCSRDLAAADVMSVGTMADDVLAEFCEYSVVGGYSVPLSSSLRHVKI